MGGGVTTAVLTSLGLGKRAEAQTTECSDGRPPCGCVCCEQGTECIGENKCCPTTQICRTAAGGAICCPPGTFCDAGVCRCNDTKLPPCNGVCCPQGQRCKDGKCVCVDAAGA